jgi:hypothetical protein
MFIGADTKAQYAKRYASAYGTSLVERLNRLAKNPLAFPLLEDTSFFKQTSNLVKKIPFINKINLGVKSSSGLKVAGGLALKLGLGVPAAILAYKQLDYMARKSSLLDNTIFSEGITAAGGRMIAGANMGPAKLQKATDLGVTLLSENEFIKLISQ